MSGNRAIFFRDIPTHMPENGKHLKLEESGFGADAEPPKNGLTVQNIYASLDPYLRGRMRDSSVKSYSPAFELNKPIDTRLFSKVLKSDNAQFKPGDIVAWMGPIAEYGLVSEGAGPSKIDNPHKLDLKEYLGPLGMPGATAYSSLYEIGKPKKGETIFVSSASGAVGSIIGQICKIDGLKVIGSVGDDSKLEYITKELGFDGGFNYKKEKPADALKRLAPDGIDIYYENVGGETLQAAIDHMNDFGRIVVCGFISQYNLPPSEQLPLYRVTQILSKRLTIQGFIQSDPNFTPKWNGEQMERLTKLLREGSFKSKMSVTDGIENGIDGLIGIFEGRNFGKSVLRISSE